MATCTTESSLPSVVAAEPNVNPPQYDKDLYVEACITKGVAPIKADYIVDLDHFKPYREATKTESTTKEDGDDLIDERESSKENVRPAREDRQRGQNKKRKLNVTSAQAAREKDVCHQLAAMNECPAGDRCNRDHDLQGRRQAILEQFDQGTFRHELLRQTFGPQCGWTKRGLICPSGISCCIDPLGHTDASGRNITSEGELVTSATLNKCRDQEYANFQPAIVTTVKKLKFDKPPARKPKENNVLLEEQSASTEASETLGPIITTTESLSIEEKRELYRKKIKGKAILAPLTTVGNLPFRRLCISLGCEVTMSEMVLASAVCGLKPADLALLRRHRSENIFGVQLAGGYGDVMSRAAKVVSECVDCDWVDINAGCPLEGLHKRGAGCALLEREQKVKEVITEMTKALPTLPLTFKTRTAFHHKTDPMVQKIVPKLIDWGISGITLHGRTAKQRYLKSADWNLVGEIAKEIDGKVPFVGNGDLFGDPQEIIKIWEASHVDAVMIGRGALIKPWIFEEIKTGQLLDPSSSERFEYLKRFCEYGIDHWGCDARGIETTRRFLLEQLSFLHRYIPVGLLERLPQKLNQRPPNYHGRDELETLMGKSDVGSWVKISEMLLGPVPEGFIFIPKHKSNSYEQC